MEGGVQQQQQQPQPQPQAQPQAQPQGVQRLSEPISVDIAALPVPVPPSSNKAYLSFVPPLLTCIVLLLGAGIFLSGPKRGFLDSARIVTFNTADVHTSNFDSRNGLYDFYSVHLLNFCKGMLTKSGERNVTRCSRAKPLFAFEPRRTMQHDTKSKNITLKDLQFPTAIDLVFADVAIKVKIMFVLYCLGLAVAACSLLAGMVYAMLAIGKYKVEMANVQIERENGQKKEQPESEQQKNHENSNDDGKALRTVHAIPKPLLRANLAFALTAAFALIAPSALLTDVARATSRVVNTYGKEINVTATSGGVIFWMTWSATISMFATALMWAIPCWKQEGVTRAVNAAVAATAKESREKAMEAVNSELVRRGDLIKEAQSEIENRDKELDQLDAVNKQLAARLNQAGAQIADLQQGLAAQGNQQQQQYFQQGPPHQANHPPQYGPQG